jgi:hypothetical protein
VNMELFWDDSDKGKPKYSEINLSRCHFFKHQSHVDWSGIESGPPRDRATNNS